MRNCFDRDWKAAISDSQDERIKSLASTCQRMDFYLSLASRHDNTKDAQFFLDKAMLLLPKVKSDIQDFISDWASGHRKQKVVDFVESINMLYGQTVQSQQELNRMRITTEGGGGMPYQNRPSASQTRAELANHLNNFCQMAYQLVFHSKDAGAWVETLKNEVALSPLTGQALANLKLAQVDVRSREMGLEFEELRLKREQKPESDESDGKKRVPVKREPAQGEVLVGFDLTQESQPEAAEEAEEPPKEEEKEEPAPTPAQYAEVVEHTKVMEIKDAMIRKGIVNEGKAVDVVALMTAFELSRTAVQNYLGQLKKMGFAKQAKQKGKAMKWFICRA